MSNNINFIAWLLYKIRISPQILIFASLFALFPFISTVTGVSIKIAGLEIWKYLWLLWLLSLAIYIIILVKPLSPGLVVESKSHSGYSLSLCCFFRPTHGRPSSSLCWLWHSCDS